MALHVYEDNVVKCKKFIDLYLFSPFQMCLKLCVTEHFNYSYTLLKEEMRRHEHVIAAVIISLLLQDVFFDTPCYLVANRIHISE